MRSSFVLRRAVGLVLGLVVAVAPLSAADPEKVSFETADGFKLAGSYWPSKEGKKAPVVLLLHNFELKKGGQSHADGWDYLAEELNKKGYAVLSFDFRGHGNSTTIADSTMFWGSMHNRPGLHLKGVKAKDTTLSHTNFQPGYYPYLVNDIIAARIYLDKKHDAGELNSQNLIVVGAGEGATLGMMWMASEMKRVRVTGLDGLGRPARWDPNPEGKDIVSGIWLSISPTLAGKTAPMTTWLKEVGGKTYKTPLLFVYGDKDDKASARALGYMQWLLPEYKRDKPRPKDYKDWEYTAEYPIKGADATASGSKLIDKDRDTVKGLISGYFEPLMEKHKITQWEQREVTTNTYAWLVGLRAVLAKAPNDKVFKVLSPSVVGMSP